MYISFATAPGRTTDSGDNGGTVSPYVRAFLKHIREPYVPIQILFPVKIGRTVYEITEGKQQPWQDDSFFDPFVITNKSSMFDSDGDGFPDDIDKCPNDYSLTNNGCKEPIAPIVKDSFPELVWADHALSICLFIKIHKGLV